MHEVEKPLTEKTPPNKFLVFLVAIPLALIGGVFVTLEAAFGVNLAEDLGNEVRATCFGFLGGFLFLLPFATQGPPLPETINTFRTTDVKWWNMFGGIFGVVFVFGGVVSTPVIGLSLFFVSVTFGQLATALIFDNFGLLKFPKRPVTYLKFFGIVLSLASVFMLQDFSDSVDITTTITYCAISVVAGIAVVFEAGLNKEAAKVWMTPVRSACAYWGVGFIALAIASAVTFAFRDWEFNGTEWWHWFAGVVASGYVVVEAILPEIIGVSNFFVTAIAGQLISSLLFDELALFGLERNEATLLRIFGVVTAIIATILISWDSHKQEKNASSPTDEPDMVGGEYIARDENSLNSSGSNKPLLNFV